MTYNVSSGTLNATILYPAFSLVLDPRDWVAWEGRLGVLVRNLWIVRVNVSGVLVPVHSGCPSYRAIYWLLLRGDRRSSRGSVLTAVDSVSR